MHAPVDPEEDVGAGVVGGREPASLGAGSQHQVLWRERQVVSDTGPSPALPPCFCETGSLTG